MTLSVQQTELQTLIAKAVAEAFATSIKPLIENIMIKATGQSSNVEIQQQPPIPIQDTLDEFANYVLYVKKRKLGTSKDYRSDVRQFSEHIEKNLGRQTLTSDFDKKSILAFVIERRQAGLDESTISRRCQGLLCYSSFLHFKTITAFTLTLDILGLHFKKRRKLRFRLNEPDFKKLLPELPNLDLLALRDWAILNVLFYENISIMTCLRLKTIDVDLERGQIIINGKARNLNSRSRQVLIEYFAQAKHNDGPLFPSKSGKPLHASNYRKFVFRRAVQQVSPTLFIKSFHPRDLPDDIRAQILNHHRRLS